MSADKRWNKDKSNSKVKNLHREARTKALSTRQGFNEYSKINPYADILHSECEGTLITINICFKNQNPSSICCSGGFQGNPLSPSLHSVKRHNDYACFFLPRL